ncbi:MAG: WD40 repeat domain-containing serine/threonine protein kinase [Verrucomicrobiota bacterium]
MEFIDGQPLNAWSAEKKPSVRERVRLLEQICAGVAHAHQNGVIHRDLKPGNILVTRDGIPKVVDFGLAKAMQSDPDPAGLSRVDLVAGTPAYMSPEQVSGGFASADTRTDVYSLGVVAYELLTSGLPYETGVGLGQIATGILETEPKRPSLTERTLDREIDAILLKALRKNVADRYESASSMRNDLERYLAGLPLVARPPSLRYALGRAYARNRPLSFVIFGSVLALAAALTYTFYSVNTARKEEAASAKEALMGQASALFSDAKSRAANHDLAGARRTLRRSREIMVQHGMDHKKIDWETFALSLHSPEVVFQRTEHQSEITSTWTSHDGSRIYSTGVDGQVRCRNFPSLSELWSVSPTKGEVLRIVGECDNGRCLVLVSEDGRWRKLDAETGEVKFTSERGPQWSMLAGSISPDGRTLATGSNAGQVLVWNLEVPGQPKLIFDNDAQALDIAYSPDGTRLLVGSRRAIILLDASSGEVLWRSETTNTCPAVEWIDDRLAAAASSYLELLNTREKSKTLCLPSGTGREITRLIYDAENDNLYSSGLDGEIRSWKVVDDILQMDRTFAGSSGAVGALAHGRNGLLLAGDEGGRLTAWSTGDAPHFRSVQTSRVSPDGSQLLGFAGSNISIFDRATSQLLHRLRIQDWPSAVWFYGDDIYFVQEDSLYRWHPADTKPLKIPGVPVGKFVVPSPIGERMLIWTETSDVRCWQLDPPAELWSQTYEWDKSPRLVWSEDEDTVVIAFRYEPATLHDAADGELIGKLENDSRTLYTFAPESETGYWWYGGADRQIGRGNFEIGTVRDVHVGHHVANLRWLKASGLLLCQGFEGESSLLDPESGEILMRISSRRPRRAGYYPHFSADAQGEVLLFQPDSGKLGELLDLSGVTAVAEDWLAEPPRELDLRKWQAGLSWKELRRRDRQELSTAEEEVTLVAIPDDTESISASLTARLLERLGRPSLVTGLVSDVAKVRTSNGMMVFINFEGNEMKDFCGVIFNEQIPVLEEAHGDLAQAFKGKEVILRGAIATYRERPQIVLRTGEQIELARERVRGVVD